MAARQPTHGLFGDRDGGYVPACGGAALRKDPSLHKVGQWLGLAGWLIALGPVVTSES